MKIPDTTSRARLLSGLGKGSMIQSSVGLVWKLATIQMNKLWSTCDSKAQIERTIANAEGLKVGYYI